MKTILYLGTDPTYFPEEGNVIHYPIIRIVPRSLKDPELKSALDDLSEYTHLIFTSKNAVRIFFEHAKKLFSDLSFLEGKEFAAVGKVTAEHLSLEGFAPSIIATEETQEGLIKELSSLDLEDAYVFFPRSSLSRPVLLDFLQQRGVRHQACDLYDTLAHPIEPRPDLNMIDEIVFTSPSTVEAFYALFGFIPKEKKLVVSGPITEEALKRRIS
ncbi:MAG: uroporphyrinogen-III synthase [Chlamydiae bacterium]|nr:uroporphyrinogen-III synthase [Chlamydiota bacterium]